MGWLLRSLHSRLLLGISLGWLLLVAAVLLYASQSGSSLIRQANIAHLEYEASLIAQDLQQAVDERIAALSRLAVQVDPTADDGLELLQANASLLEFFDLLVMVSAEGEVVADWPQLDGRVGLDVSQREYFRFISQVRRPYVSEPFDGGASREPLVMIGVPIFDEQGELAGMLGGVVNLRNGSFFSNLRRIRIGNAGFAVLASVSGRILSHPNEALIMAPTPSAEINPFFDLALSGWEGAMDEGQLLSGEPALQAFRQVWSAGWVVGVFLPKSQVQGPIKGFVNGLWWVDLVTVGLMLPLLWWLLHALLSPLRSLKRQIGRTGNDEASRVHLKTDMRELQEIAEAFNRAQDRRGEAVAMLKDRQAFLDAVLASSPVGMFVCNLKGEIEYLNPALSELTGYGLGDYRDDALLSHIHRDYLKDTLDLWRDTLRTGRDFQRQFRYIAASGDILWIEVHINQVHSIGGTLGYVGTVKDITQRRQKEALQRWEAEHDPLTGLLNRRGFERRLDEAMAEWHKTGSPSALLMIDLDNFKPINDEGGHALGDEMLRRIAQVITWEVRRSDHVARQGGDEFAVLMPSCTLPHAERVATTLQNAVRVICVSHEGKEYRVSLSIGIAGFEESDKDIDSLLARADDACYEAKAQGRDKVILANVTH